MNRRWSVGALAAALALPLLLAPASRAARRAPAPPPPPRAFDLRGIVEGSYGPPWSHSDRLDAVRWLGRHGMNMYVHAPKDDPYQRYSWREPYPPLEMADYREEIAVARAAGVDWVPNISPGVPAAVTPIGRAGVPSRGICFACADDIDLLVAKFEPFIAAGARTVMVSFDDVRTVSTHPEDAIKYGAGSAAYAAMNHDLLDALADRLGVRHPGVRLLTVLPEYSGTVDNDYLAGFRARGRLADGITVLWTGAYVISHDIPVRDAAAFARLIGVDRIGLWDNFPANDLSGNFAGVTRRLYLGPYEGRDPDLNQAVSGVLINVMNEAWANRIPLGSVSEYLADPRHYRPEDAWRRAIADAAGGDPTRTDALAAFAENSRSSVLDENESPGFRDEAERFTAALDAGAFWTDEYRALVDEAHRETRATDVLRAGFPELRDEADRFLIRLGQNASVIEAGADVLARQHPSLDVVRSGDDVTGCARHPVVTEVAEAVRLLDVAQANTAASTGDVHGDRATPTFGLRVNENLVDAFYRTVSIRHARWLPTAGLAATSISVTVDGKPVPLDLNGCFRATSHSSATVIAIDGAGRTVGRSV